ncbi:unnamed protein product [Linum tenue]|uniref:Uncharacterized protein n=1 Tax=Linum tenue TaxID=586396 RepID=A0AAV0Q1T5_9ROSI|nr:unnamed protein product [Linum tenue]
MRVKREGQICGSDSGDGPIDALPCSVYLGSRRISIPKTPSVNRTTGPTRHSRKSGWTKHEDHLLTKTVQKFQGRRWRLIAECLPGRSISQCFYRWHRVLNPSIFKGTWTKEEDDCIRELVRIHGLSKWSVIARFLPGRLGKQCRERWHNHLDPRIKAASWTEDEERTLAFYHEIYGNKWASLARYLPGRSCNAIKNHWNCLLRNNLAVNQPTKCSCAAESPCLDIAKSPLQKKLASIAKTKKRIAFSSAVVAMEENDSREFSNLQSSPSEYVLPSTESLPRYCRQSNVLSVLDMNTTEEKSPPLLALTNEFSKQNGDEGNQVKEQVPGVPTPRSHTQGSSVVLNPETILRNSAKTFRNMPSIIRKRSSMTRNETYATMATSSGSGVTRCSSSLLSGQQGFLSLFHKSYPAFAVQSLRRNLDSAFDP